MPYLVTPVLIPGKEVLMLRMLDHNQFKRLNCVVQRPRSIKNAHSSWRDMTSGGCYVLVLWNTWVMIFARSVKI